ncbi:MAG TPA: DAK2 domain-containing protein [Ilumatobacteraceae bacterium]|nr:DAK2 domain-containing protein [Ilumatobacteraceae bacterium]
MPTLERLNTAALRETVHTFRDTVREHAHGLNRLNVYPVPDGDTGTNMARTLDAVVAEMDSTDADDHDGTCDAISYGSLMGARGNSGVILSQIMRGFAGTLKQQADVQGAKFAEALQAATTGAYDAVLKPIEGTILTVCRESAEAAKESADAGGSLVDVVRAARAAGKIALDNTPEQLPVLKDAGVVDAGGAGFLLLLDSVLHVVDGEPLPVAEPDDGSTVGAVGDAFDVVAHRHAERPGELDVSEQRYEVMYFLELADDRIRDFKVGWGAIGDSIVVVGGDGLWNCHVHTNEIGASIEVALDLGGRPKMIRVTDLFEEVDDEHARREAELAAMAHDMPVVEALPSVTTAVVAVCSGDGLVELFAQLGVQGVVTGGQTMNPSTAELLETVQRVNADQVVILPNNKNIIPVAEQIGALTDKDVVVVPTRSMPEALAALVVYDADAPVQDNASDMSAAAESVVTGEITQAVRDSNSAVGPVAEGDWIGLIRGDGIASVSTTVEGAATALLERIVGDGAELVTVITGADADDDVTATLTAWLSDHRGDVTVDVHRGGQPLYPYLFGVE